MDISNEAQVESGMAEVLKRFGRLDILVTTPRQYRQIFVNMTSPSGGGRIVNMI